MGAVRGGEGRAWGRGFRAWLAGALLACLSACATAPRVSVQSALTALPAPLHMRDEGLRRSASFGGLHETARLLIIAHGVQAEWLARGVVPLPLESCFAAVGFRSNDAA